MFALFEFAGDLPALEIIFAVMLVDFAQHAAGVAHRHTVRGDILRHHAARTDDGVVADGNAGQDERARADPAVFADMHGQIVLQRRRRKLGRMGCPAVATTTFGPNMVPSPT